MIGLVASTIGLLLGFGIAQGACSSCSARWASTYPRARRCSPSARSLISLVVGTAITLLATIVPARRATRVPPIAAVREGSTLPASRFAAHSRRTGLGVLLASVAAIAGALAGSSGLLAGVGVFMLFLALALLARHLVKPLAWLVGWPARRAGGVAGELAQANAVRNPGRTASTAAALMIGLTLVTVVAVLGAGLNSSTKSAITDQLRADFVVDGNNGLPFRAAEGDELARVPGVQGRLARSHRQSARRRRADRRHRHRSGDDRAVLPVRWVEGSDGRRRNSDPTGRS